MSNRIIAGALPRLSARRSTRPQWVGDRRVWLLSGLVAIGGGATLNWSWLSAIGAVPILLSLLPCLAMCGAGLCMFRGQSSSGSGPDAEKAGE